MKAWKRYTAWVNRHCGNLTDDVRDLSYWRNELFAGIIIYLLPLCLIALLPGLYWIFRTGQSVLAIVDILTVAGIAVIAFMPGIGLGMRKIIFIFCVYMFSVMLLYYLGLYGPGMVYLLACCIFSILILPTAWTFVSAWINTFICFCFGVGIWLNVIPWAGQVDHLVGAWVAISTNLVFLSFLSAALIPRLFNGLQQTIDKEKRLKEELGEQQHSLEQALKMLQQKNNELEQFAYVASHDLNEPIRTVTSFMTLLKNKYGKQLDEKAHTYIDFALDGGKRMQKMIGDLLELSRTARQDAVKEPVKIGELLKEVEQNIFHLIRESRTEIIVTTELPVLTVYRAGISSLLQNLLSNAIKYRKKDVDPVIRLRAMDMKEEWLFCVEDNGIGIQKEKFEKIFEIFARLHSQKTYEGTGIGLAVCKKVAENHGGKIWVESEAGKGSTFCFTIKNENNESGSHFIGGG